MIDDFGFIQSFLLMILTIGAFWIIMYFVMNIHNLRKDLKHKVKVSAKVKVKKIEHLSAKVAEAMEGNKDTILHFEKNSFKVKNFYFNKKIYPKYLNAQEILIERAKYSKIEFKSDIL